MKMRSHFGSSHKVLAARTRMAARKEEEGRPRKPAALVPNERLLKEDGARFEDGARVLQEARNCLRTWINADEFRATVGKRINYQQAYQILEDEELMRCNDLPNEDKHRCAVFPLVDMEPAKPEDHYDKCRWASDGKSKSVTLFHGMPGSRVPRLVSAGRVCRGVGQESPLLKIYF